MQIRVTGTANLSAMEAQFAAVTAQVEALNREMARSAMIPAGGSPANYAKLTRGINAANTAFNSALAASGAYHVEQLKVNDAVARHTELLQKQKLSFREVFGAKNRNLMNAMYREQLALQQAQVRTMRGVIGDGSQRMALAIPTAVEKSWDSLNQRIGFFGHQLSSASQQLVNWGKNTQWAGRQLMAGITMPMAAFGAAAGVMAYQVDQQLTRVAKVYDTTANQNSASLAEVKAAEEELKQVREAGMQTAIKAAKQYGASATDTLDVQAELAATGIKGQALQESTNQVMRIATLGEIDHATATKALISLQSVLRLNTKETADAFNYMNSVENATSLSTNDFAEAIPRALGPMKQMGGNLQDLAMLLVAMKERGIDAGEGANAIKAMMQRLYRPSEQVRKEWVQIAKLDPLKAVREEGGDIMKILPRIADAVQGLSRPDRVKLLSGLFGTYQVTRMNAMLEGIEDMNKGVGQTSRVLQVNAQGWEQWGKTAEGELRQRTESISGKFKIALETLKAELADIGAPFLEVATWFLKIFTAGAHLFNAMPGWAKKLAIIVGLLGAAAGPLIMLVGLFANFAGNLGKMAGTILKWVSNFELLTKSQVGARVAAKLAESQFVEQANSANLLTTRVEALTLAMTEYARSLHLTSGLPIPAGLQAPLGPHGPAAPTVAQREQMYLAAVPSRNAAGQFTSNEVRLAEARNRLANEYMASMGVVARDASDIEKKAVAEAKVRDRIKGSVNGAAVSTGVMAASMATMMLTSNETANNIAQWALISTMVVPAVKGLAPVIGSLATSSIGFAAAMGRSVKTSAAVAGRTAAAAGKGRALWAATKGAALGFSSMLGPIGWTALALTTIGVITYKIWQHNKQIREEQEKQAAALYDQKNLMADALKIRIKEKQQLFTASPTDRPGQASAAQLSQEMLAEPTMKPLIDSIANARSETERNTIATKKYIEILSSVGGNATKAQRYVEALYRAAGQDALEATINAQKLSDSLGPDISKGELSTLYTNLFTGAIGDTEDSVQMQGTELGKMLADSIARGANRNADQTLVGFNNAVKTGWDQTLAGLDERTRAVFKQMGIDSGKELRQAIADYSALSSGDMNRYDFARKYNIPNIDETGVGNIAAALQLANEQANASIAPLIANEKAVVKELARQLGIKQDLATIDQLRATWEWRLQTASKQNANELYKARLKELDIQNTQQGQLAGLMGVSKEYTDEQKLAVLNQIRLAMGLQATNNLSDGFKKNLHDASDDSEKIKDNLNNVPHEIDVSIKPNQVAGIFQEAMGAVQSDYADMMSSDFENKMNNAIDNFQASWDARKARLEDEQQRAQDQMEARQERETSRLENQQERQTEQFDKRWERRKKAVDDAYQTRIDNIQKEIDAEQKAEEIRQRIFEAEQTRLERLAETANRTIDFNMALQTGNLDEAAKLRNDMEAQAANWALGDAADRGSRASERRQQRLENRQQHLEDQRDKVLERIERQEEAQRKSLERRQEMQRKALEKEQEMERKHLEKVQEMRADSLAKQAEDAVDAYRKEWEKRKDNLDRQLELFKSFVPKNRRELAKWIKEMGGEYKEFGQNTLNPLSDKWGKWFEDHFRQHIRIAGRKIQSDNMWERLGKVSAKKLLQGFGFNSMSGFERFVKTGNLPKDFGQKPENDGGKGGMKDFIMQGPRAAGARHTGGWVNAQAGSRKGVARTAPLQRSERLMNLRNGEFVVNERAAKANAPVLEAMNKGVMDPSTPARKGIMGGFTPPGIAGLLSAAVMKMFAAGIGQSLTNAYDAASMQAYSGMFGTIGAGRYGDVVFDAQQLKNAGIIASVGKSMGMSGRDIEIGIMTAITESMLRNIHGGDRDSQGLFQQRPSMGWGTVAQVTNPRYAATQFFKALKGVTNRGSMSPWMAAQSVQRSAYSDGSNYRPYWDEANAIFKALKNAGTSGFVMGPGGRHRPIAAGIGHGGIHDEYTGYPAVDFATPVGTRVYSVADGTITKSYDIKGYEPRNAVQNGYRSYGKVIYLKTDAGPEVLYAHLSKRGVSAGTRVKGGSVIGLTGNTGHSTGPHLHFGATNGPLAWLKNGGMTLNDGMAMLHRGETVLTSDLTDDLKATVKAFGKESRDRLTGKHKRTRRRGRTPSEWGPDNTPVDRYNSGIGWTWLSGIGKNAVAAVENIKKMTNSTPPSSGKGDLRTGTYNLRFDTKNASTKNDLSKLFGMADVLSLQEFTGRKRGLIPWIKSQGWGVFAPGTGAGHDSGVIWNQRAYKFLGGDSMPMNPKGRGGHHGKIPYAPHYAAFAHLKSLATGQGLWQIAAHTIAHADSNPAAVKIRAIQYAMLNGLYKKLRQSDPVFLGGDLNLSGSSVDILKRIGMATNRKGGLDHLMYDPRFAKQVGGRTVGGLSSDHDAYLAQFNIPSHRSGAENIRWDNTLVNMHKKESILTAEQSDKFRRLANNIDNVATGRGDEYNIRVEVTQPNASADEIANKVLTVLERRESRKPTRRRS